jgi:predicted dehydrogenase
MKQVKLGLIGAGRISQTYAQVLASVDFARLTAVADIRPGVAAAVAGGLQADSFETYEELLEKSDVDAVIVCTPPVTHTQITMDALGRGVHVMCEKPLAISLADANKMLDFAARSNAIVTMASKFRYVDDVVRARSIMSSGILGDIILLENTFASRVDMSQRWNSDPVVSGGGVLIDNGTHSVDVIRHLLGPIKEVMAVEGRRAQGLEVEDTAQLFLRGESGVRATVDLSWSIDKERDTYLDIYGSEGTIRVGWRESKYRQTSSPNWVTFGRGYDKVQATTDQMRNFCRAFTDGEPLRITADDALASVEVIEAAYASMTRVDWVPISRSERTLRSVAS